MGRSSPKKSTTISGGTALILIVLVACVYLFGQFRGGTTTPDTPPVAEAPTARATPRATPRARTPTARPGAPTPVVLGGGTGAPASGGAIQVFFTTPDLIYPDRPANRVLTPIEQAIVADIDGAKTSVDLATFEYNLPSVRDALLRAKKRGIAVRLALDRENLDKPEMADWAGAMQKAKIPIAWEDTQAFLHSKFIIVDRKLVWMGSWNDTVNDTYRNNNNLLRITVPEIVENYSAEFEQMSEGVFGRKKESLAPNPLVKVGKVPVENYFSPQDGIAKHIVQYIRAAKKSVRFLAFSYTADDIRDAMIDRKDAGLFVQGVFEQRNAQGVGAEYQPLIDAGVEVLSDGNCYTMHHKVIIIDDHLVITGSYNFTGRAENDNDENVIIIDDPAIARQYIEEYDRVYGQAANGTRCG